VKLRSAPLDDIFGELTLVLVEQRNPAARLLLREARQRYGELRRHYIRLLRAGNGGVFCSNSGTSRRVVRRRAGGS